jgi:hypothetical protein
MKTRCERGVHKFEARYHKIAPEWMERVTSFKAVDVESLYEKNYVLDICVRCGRTIKNKQEDK